VHEPVTGRLLYDLTGLVHWYGYFRRPGGVQRVVEKVAVSDAIRQSPNVEFVMRVLGSDRFFRIDPGLVAALAERRAGAVVRLRRMLAQAMRLATPSEIASEGRHFHLPYLAMGLSRSEGLFEAWSAGQPLEWPSALELIAPPGARDTLFNPGDLWWQKRYVENVGGLKRRAGMRILQLVHDLYLIDRPEWTPADSVRVFRSQLEGIAPFVDCWLTVSQFMKDRLQRYLAEHGLPERPIAILPMGWDSFARPISDPHATLDKAVLERHHIAGAPFILFVGTVEPRKNVSALLDSLDELRARLGGAVPRLVIAGSYGWRAPEVRRRLQRAARAGHVSWLKSVDDKELAVLYRNARFTVMPSHGEGWGLAVQESIAQGVPCIASSGGATREAGRDLATYFDPSRPGELTEAMAKWIKDEGALAESRSRIQQALGTADFPTWAQAGKVLLGLASRAVATSHQAQPGL
jgi:glycosyltransferase involved in cell wall biosynthesis